MPPLRESLALVLAAAAGCAHDVTAQYPRGPIGGGAVEVLLNDASSSVSVTINDQLVVERAHTGKVHIDGVPPGHNRVSVASGGRCEQGALTQFDLDVPAGGIATIALPGPEPNLGCQVFTGLYYVGLNIGIAAIAIAAVGAGAHAGAHGR